MFIDLSLVDFDLSYNSYQGLLYRYIEHPQCSSRYCLKQAHIYYVFLLLSWFRWDVKCKFCISAILNHYYHQLRNQNHLYLTILEKFLRYCISFWSHFKMILSLKKNYFIINEPNFKINIWKWVVLNEKIQMWAFLLQNKCFKRVSTMSHVLSECVIKLLDVVLYHS